MKKYSTKSSEWNPETYKNDHVSFDQMEFIPLQSV